MDAQERFAALAEKFAALPDVELPGESGRRAFGSEAMKVNGAIFAMVTNDHLVVKLPEERVRGLIGEGSGAPFGAGKGRPMREWVSVTVDDDETWLALAREALDFVRSRPRR
jgi:TfoX/Sxy family transcriptional regulator of competence genes